MSVLMTAFNREKYIASAIESVLASAYKDFELLIVDDSSTDETVKIAKEYAAKDDRVKVFINDKNFGDYPNRNKAASLAKGKYLKYVDSDDYIYPNGLEIMVKSMEDLPEAGFGLCSLKPDAERPFPFMLQPKEAYEYHFFGPGLFHKGPLTAIFLKSAFDKMGGFKEDRMISDTDMWHRMALQFPVVLMPDGIVWQRRHAEQELNDVQNYIVEGAKIKWKYLVNPACPLVNEQIKQIRKMRIKRYSGFVLSGIAILNFKQSRIYMKCLLMTLKIKV
ncbi:MAG: glycosyltransferase [Bacteroidota bacterium]|nr:glycosyltransferase [Bacteroidota bacterium]